MLDYYSILGIAPGATSDQIKKAYKKEARRHHPDKIKQRKDGQVGVRMHLVNDAWEVLGNSRYRECYDQALEKLRRNEFAINPRSNFHPYFRHKLDRIFQIQECIKGTCYSTPQFDFGTPPIPLLQQGREPPPLDIVVLTTTILLVLLALFATISLFAKSTRFTRIAVRSDDDQE